MVPKSKPFHQLNRCRASIIHVNKIYNVTGKLSELWISFVLAQHVHQIRLDLRKSHSTGNINTPKSLDTTEQPEYMLICSRIERDKFLDTDAAHKYLVCNSHYFFLQLFLLIDGIL